MGLVDDLELQLLADTGDVELAEAAGVALRITVEAIGALLGLPADWAGQ